MSDGKDNKRSGKSAGKSNSLGSLDNAEFVGYVNVNLSPDQKEAYASWSESSSLWDTLTYQVSTGVNVSIKRSLKEDCYIASATQRNEASPNAGLCVTARGGEPFVAFGRVLFILAYLSHAEKWTDLQPVANPDRW